MLGITFTHNGVCLFFTAITRTEKHLAQSHKRTASAIKKDRSLTHLNLKYANKTLAYLILNTGSVISDLRFADDIALFSESECNLQYLINKVVEVSARFGLKISTAKTEVQCIGRDAQPLSVYLRGGQLHQTNEFVSSDKDIDRREALAVRIVRSLNNVRQ